MNITIPIGLYFGISLFGYCVGLFVGWLMWGKKKCI